MAKGKIINFEKLCEFNYISKTNYDILIVDRIKKDIEKVYQEGYNIIIGVYLIEGFCQLAENPYQAIRDINEIKKFARDRKIDLRIISGRGEKFQGLPVISFFFDYNQRMVYEAFKFLISDNNLTNYNQNAKKFLFIGGSPDRLNRTYLLSKFYDENLLSQAEWSYFAPTLPSEIEWCRNCLKKYSDIEYEQFIKFVERSFDNRYQQTRPTENGYKLLHEYVDTDFEKSNSYIDPNIFNNTSFSIISEGPNPWSDDYGFVTEKTWRTIFLRHPFIFAGHPDQFRYLKKLGFKTFEEYMAFPEYAYIADNIQRYNTVMLNAKFFLDDMKKYQQQIKDDVEFNYQLFLKYIQKQDDFLKWLRTTYNVSDDDISHYFLRTGYSHLLVN